MFVSIVKGVKKVVDIYVVRTNIVKHKNQPEMVDFLIYLIKNR